MHALVGENGAGKSTLMKVMGGIHQPDSGTIELYGDPTTVTGPLDAQQRGISIIHQEFNLMPDLTVAENIFFGREPKSTGGVLLDNAAIVTQTRELLDRLGILLDPHMRVGRLSVASQQMVEIAKALSFDSRVLIMDEPTAALTDSEVETLFTVIDGFITPDTGVIYVSHRMEEIMRISDRITVLRDGGYVATQNASDVTIDQIIQQMVGREIAVDVRPEPSASRTELALEVEGLSTPTLVRDVSFTLAKGEILGFAGLMGAGRTEVARALVGADPSSSGTVTVDGKVVNIASPADAVRLGIGYLSEDRKHFGLCLDKDITENIALPNLSNWSTWWGMIRDGQAASIATQYVKSLRIRTPGIRQLTKNLSGGNQQKVVLAKWLARDCDVLIFDEPTRGIDIGAKDEIYTLLTQLAQQGKAIIVISSEIPEVLRLADRILVMCEGRITGELLNADATQEKIMTYATKFHTALTKEAR